MWMYRAPIMEWQILKHSTTEAITSRNFYISNKFDNEDKTERDLRQRQMTISSNTHCNFEGIEY